MQLRSPYFSELFCFDAMKSCILAICNVSLKALASSQLSGLFTCARAVYMGAGRSVEICRILSIQYVNFSPWYYYFVYVNQMYFGDEFFALAKKYIQKLATVTENWGRKKIWPKKNFVLRSISEFIHKSLFECPTRERTLGYYLQSKYNRLINK